MIYDIGYRYHRIMMSDKHLWQRSLRLDVRNPYYTVFTSVSDYQDENSPWLLATGLVSYR